MNDSIGVPISLCPACGYAFDSVSAIDSDKPRPSAGDRGICLSCAALLIYAEDGTPERLADADEQREMMAIPVIAASVRHILDRGPIRKRNHD